MRTTTHAVDFRYTRQELLALFAIANHEDVEAGGRYDARGGAITVWSHHWQHAATRHDSETMGTFYFHWGDPSTLYQVECDAGFGLEELLRELGTLELKALGELRHGRRANAPPHGLSASCSWCNTLNPITTPTCTQCGHDAHRPRMECTCPQCQRSSRGLDL